MKLLLDEQLPHELRHEVVSHEAMTVAYAGLSGGKNGSLLRRAAELGFDALVSNDKTMRYEQNQATLPIAVVILDAPTNKLEAIRPLLPKLLRVLGSLPPRRFVKLGDVD